jgi:hypothetical protein
MELSLTSVAGKWSVVGVTAQEENSPRRVAYIALALLKIVLREHFALNLLSPIDECIDALNVASSALPPRDLE